jgi:hypothetical protein
VKVRDHHEAIVNDKENRQRIIWLKNNREEEAARVLVAAQASWIRTQDRPRTKQDLLRHIALNYKHDIPLGSDIVVLDMVQESLSTGPTSLGVTFADLLALAGCLACGAPVARRGEVAPFSATGVVTARCSRSEFFPPPDTRPQRISLP